MFERPCWLMGNEASTLIWDSAKKIVKFHCFKMIITFPAPKWHTPLRLSMAHIPAVRKSTSGSCPQAYRRLSTASAAKYRITSHDRFKMAEELSMPWQSSPASMARNALSLICWKWPSILSLCAASGTEAKGYQAIRCQKCMCGCMHRTILKGCTERQSHGNNFLSKHHSYKQMCLHI